MFSQVACTRGAYRCQKRTSDPLELEIHPGVDCHVDAGIKLSPLQEHQLLLTTEPSLQLQGLGFLT